MTNTMELSVSAPLCVVLNESNVTSVRAEDASGGFGILPGHADLLTVLEASVLHWRRAEGGWHYCALRGGVLRVMGGTRIEIACREAIPGDDLPTLEARVREHRDRLDDEARQARGDQMRLHAQAIRRLMQGADHDHAAQDLAEAFR